MTRSIYAMSFYALPIAAVLLLSPRSLLADEAAAKPAPTKHQLMKDCMAKEKASDGGMPKEDMKKDCKEVTKTENDNAKAEEATQQNTTQGTAKGTPAP